MYIEINERYNLKEGASPMGGRAFYGTKDLILQAVDPSDGSVLVCPDGISERGSFWCDPKDLEVA
jgi:hypothetical protein